MPRKKKKPRRGHGEGSVYPLKNGRWAFSKRAGGVRVQSSRKTEAEALAALEALETEIAQKGQPKRQLLKDFLGEWMERVVHPPTYTPNTRDNYAQMIRVHINPCLGHKPLASLTREDVSTLTLEIGQKVNPRTGEPLSAKTVRNGCGVLSRALKVAVEWGRVRENVAAQARLPRSRKFKINPYSEEEAKAFLRLCRDHPYGIAFEIGLLLGLRKGEVLALEWGDFDFKTKRLHVRGTKSAGSDRHIALSDPLCARLEAYREDWKRRKAERGDQWKAGDRLIVNPSGAPLAPRTLANHFYRLSAKVRPIRLHDLRHTCATIRIMRGENIRAVSQLLGHANPSMTLNVYSHVLDAYEQQSADRLNDLLDDGLP